MKQQALLAAIALLCWSAMTLAPTTCWARDIYVHPTEGDNANDGSKSAPLAFCKRAVARAEPGDVIHLLPPGAVYRQSIYLGDKKDLTIEGNGVTLDGADPLPETGWEEVGPNLHRRLIHRSRDRNILIVDGKAQKMGRSAGKAALDLFPSPEELEPGEFCVVPADEKQGWLYVAGSLEDLEWSVRESGLATRHGSNILVKNLSARHFLNDGFNLHGRTTGVKLVQVQGYDCFDEGISVHDFCVCHVYNSTFWGCDRAVADVHGSQTHYYDCEFRAGSEFDVHFRGRRHSLTNCRIINTTPAAALAVGPCDRKNAVVELHLKQTTIQGKLKKPTKIRIQGAEATFEKCDFKNVELDTSGSNVSAVETTIDGPWRK